MDKYKNYLKGFVKLENLAIIEVKEDGELKQCLQIRNDVFVNEQNVPKSVEIDRYDCLDGQCRHFLIKYKDENAGALRCLKISDNEVKLQRFCINETMRKKGFGKAAVNYIEGYYAEKGVIKITLDAQCRAVGFYEKCGYKKVSDIFMEAGIEHIKMEKTIGSAMLKKSDFYYELPNGLIAQTPAEPRDSSRLMKIDRKTGEIIHDHFYNLPEYLKEGDLLVLNDSKVFPARIYGIKRDTGVPCEFLLLKRLSLTDWETLVRPGRRLKKGAEVDFPEGLSAEILDTVEDGNRIARFSFEGDFFDILDRIGQMPLPPYITEKLKDNERYNTIYCRETGSAAAPTAGLHFTERVFDKLREKGVKTAYVTLHVGLGTFRPVKEENILEHKMHIEHYSIPEETARIISETKERGGRVISVGTTSCRTLESAAGLSEDGKIKPCANDTGIFIYPGYKFKVIDGLITNFHLPESTLIMLVSAFLGREKTLDAYKNAIQNSYRFFSFGDAMFIE